MLRRELSCLVLLFISSSLTAASAADWQPAKGPLMTRWAKDVSPDKAANRQTMGEAIAKSAVRSVTSSIGSSIGRALVRGVLGSLLKR